MLNPTKISDIKSIFFIKLHVIIGVFKKLYINP